MQGSINALLMNSTITFKNTSKHQKQMMLGWETLNRALQSMYLNHTASVSCVLKIQVYNTTSSKDSLLLLLLCVCVCGARNCSYGFSHTKQCPTIKLHPNLHEDAYN